MTLKRNLFLIFIALLLIGTACAPPQAPETTAVDEPALAPAAVDESEEAEEELIYEEVTEEDLALTEEAYPAPEPTTIPESYPEEPANEADPDAYPAESTDTVETVEETESTDSETAEIDASLPLLPSAQVGAPTGGLGGGGEIASIGAGDGVGIQTEGLSVADESTLLPAPFNPFEGTEFVFATDLQNDFGELPVYRQPEQYQDLQEAIAIASQFGFPLPLYQESIPAEFRSEADLIEEGVFRMPFVAFRGQEVLTIMSGNVFYENRGVELEYSTNVSFDVTAPLVEAQLAEWGGLPFNYALNDEGFGSVSVRRLIDGQPLDYGEAYFTYNNNGQLVFANYNTLNEISTLGNYPITAPQVAWEEIVANVGQYNNRSWFIYEYNEDFAAIEPAIAPLPDEFQFWQRTYNPGAEISVFGYPLVYQPVLDDSLPLIRLNEYTVTGDAELMVALAGRQAGQVSIQGQLMEDGLTIQMTDWKDQPDIDTLFLQGTIIREDIGGILTTETDGTFLLQNLPDDLENNTQVYVFAYGAEERVEFPFPVLNWESIEKFIDYSALEGEGDVIEPDILPVDPYYDQPFAQFTIESAELVYSYAPIWPELGDELEYVQPEWDFPAVLLVPTWQFSGVSDTGQRITFSVVAVDAAYFEAQ